MTDNKSEIRAVAKSARHALTSDEIHDKSLLIFNNLLSLPCFINAETVMIYISAFNEPDTSTIIKYLRDNGKKIVVPISNTNDYTITPSYLPRSDKLKRGAYGIPEPVSCVKADINDIDAALIPGVAFDAMGGRMGFGKGYYDRFLERFSGTKIGICYDFQIFDRIPVLPHDVSMDIIITEKRIYNDF